MSPSSDHRRSLYELVRTQGAERRYLDHATELETLRKAVFDMGLASFEAESLVIGGAAAAGVALESRVDRVIEILLRASADAKDRIRHDDFARIVRYARALANQALDEGAAEAKVKQLALRLKLRPRRRGLLRGTRWFRRAGRRRQGGNGQGGNGQA